MQFSPNNGDFTFVSSTEAQGKLTAIEFGCEYEAQERITWRHNASIVLFCHECCQQYLHVLREVLMSLS